MRTSSSSSRSTSESGRILALTSWSGVFSHEHWIRTQTLSIDAKFESPPEYLEPLRRSISTEKPLGERLFPVRENYLANDGPEGIPLPPSLAPPPAEARSSARTRVSEIVKQFTISEYPSNPFGDVSRQNSPHARRGEFCLAAPPGFEPGFQR